MGFLKNFFRDVFHEQPETHSTSSFELLGDDELDAHLKIARYGDFTLTGAVRPSYDLQVVPQQAYRHDVFRDEATKVSVPVLMAAASSECLFELFIDLLDPLGNTVDVVLETSHSGSRNGHDDLHREQIDMPVLKSMLYDHEDMLLNDGCCGIAVLNGRIPLEVQFDEHKMLIVYGKDLSDFEAIFAEHGVPCNDEVNFITEAEHVHASTEEYAMDFCVLKNRLGIDSMFD